MRHIVRRPARKEELGMIFRLYDDLFLALISIFSIPLGRGNNACIKRNSRLKTELSQFIDVRTAARRFALRGRPGDYLSLSAEAGNNSLCSLADRYLFRVAYVVYVEMFTSVQNADHAGNKIVNVNEGPGLAAVSFYRKFYGAGGIGFDQ